MKEYRIFCENYDEARLVKIYYEDILKLKFRGIIPMNHKNFLIYNESPGFCSFGDGCEKCYNNKTCCEASFEFITAKTFLNTYFRKNKLKRILDK